jgi:hypothetical protein
MARKKEPPQVETIPEEVRLDIALARLRPHFDICLIDTRDLFIPTPTARPEFCNDLPLFRLRLQELVRWQRHA